MLKFGLLVGKSDLVGEAFTVQHQFNNKEHCVFKHERTHYTLNPKAANFLVSYSFEGNIGTVSYVPEAPVKLGKMLRFIDYATGHAYFLEDHERDLRNINPVWGHLDFEYVKVIEDNGMAVFKVNSTLGVLGTIDEVPFFIGNCGRIRDHRSGLLIPHAGRSYDITPVDSRTSFSKNEFMKITEVSKHVVKYDVDDFIVTDLIAFRDRVSSTTEWRVEPNPDAFRGLLWSIAAYYSGSVYANKVTQVGNMHNFIVSFNLKPLGHDWWDVYFNDERFGTVVHVGIIGIHSSNLGGMKMLFPAIFVEDNHRKERVAGFDEIVRCGVIPVDDLFHPNSVTPFQEGSQTVVSGLSTPFAHPTIEETISDGAVDVVVVSADKEGRQVLQVTLDDNDPDPASTVKAVRDQYEKVMQGKYPGDPLDLVTSKFTPREIIYNHDGFVIAQGIWRENGGKDTVLACRWHPKDGIGYPNGFGRPQWFLLPANVEDVTRSTNPIVPDEITLRFRGEYKKPTIGHWITTKDGTNHLVVYVYGEADEMVAAIGLGKTDSYPIPIHRIGEVERCKSVLSTWHAGKECIWLSQDGFWYHSALIDSESPNDHNNVYMLRRLEVARPIDAPPTWRFGEWRHLAYFYQLDQMILTDEVEPGTDILKLMSEQDSDQHFFTMEDLVSCEFEPPVPKDGWGMRTTADLFFDHERFYRIKGN